MQRMQFSSRRIQNDPLNLFDEPRDVRSQFHGLSKEVKLAIRFQLHDKVSVLILLIAFFQEVFYLGQKRPAVL